MDRRIRWQPVPSSHIALGVKKLPIVILLFGLQFSEPLPGEEAPQDVKLAEGHQFGDSASTERRPLGQIPFRLDRNRIILPVSVSNWETLDIILDTGMTFEGVYLFHKELSDVLGSADAVEVRVGGAGSGEASYAIMADSQMLSSGGMEFHNQKVVVAQNETTQDFRTDGVMGYTLFGSYTVEIDYDQQVINLHNPERFVADTTWEEVKLTFKKEIPFLDVSVSIEGDEEIPISVYIDLAAGEALELLVKPDLKFSLPDSLTEERYLGTGLSGDIHGRIGSISRLKIGSLALTDVPTTFPPGEVRSKQEGADGILGNGAISRFNAVFDYSHGVLYLKPNRQ
jgi:hypothetical protein